MLIEEGGEGVDEIDEVGRGETYVVYECDGLKMIEGLAWLM